MTTTAATAFDAALDAFKLRLSPPRPLPSPEDAEWAKCAADPVYFIRTYCHIFHKDAGRWGPFDLWACQVETVGTLDRHKLVAVLKARQQGFTWVVLCFLLWLCLFRPIQRAYLFSIGDREAMELTGWRLAGLCHRLPEWMRLRAWRDGKPSCTAHATSFDNGGYIESLPSTGGRSYTATFILIDEADFNKDLDAVMAAVEATVDGGGWLVMLSTSNKKKPQSRFKKMWRAAPGNGYVPLFYGYDAHPGRDANWYAAKEVGCAGDPIALDLLRQEYPRTSQEALAPSATDKRLPHDWLLAAYVAAPGLGQNQLWADNFYVDPDVLSLPGLSVFRKPEPEAHYVIGVDPAEGNPTSDESAACVLDEGTGEQVAVLAGRFQPEVIAGYAAELAKWYNNAGILVERNNHGHAVLLWLREFGGQQDILFGDDGRQGWNETNRTKAILYDNAVNRFRPDKYTKKGRCVVRDETTFFQLCSVEGATNKAPEGEHDDRAIAYVVALAAIDLTPRGRIGVYV